MYNAKNAFNTYNNDKVLTASPVELIIMLYDEMIKQLKIAGFAIEENNIEKANASIKKCQDIVNELVKCLDLNYQISREIIRIYDFLNHSLVKLNLEKDISSIQPLIDIIKDLKSAWVEVKQKVGVSYSVE